jgi:hypothetical protein
VTRASYTTSLASKTTDYKHEHGRRYHAYKEGSEFVASPYRLAAARGDQLTTVYRQAIFIPTTRFVMAHSIE